MALQRLEHSGYRVADESTDIRGWKLYDSAGGEFGKIDGMLFDPDANQVRYAIVDTHDNRCVLVPVGGLDIDDSNRRVTARMMTRDRLMGLREYREGEFTETEEREHFRGIVPEHREERLNYEHPTFRENLGQRIQLIEEQLKIGKREAQIGEVVAQKHPVTETVNQDVQVRREHVEIERHKVNKPVTGKEHILDEGETIRVPIYGEEVITEKRPVIMEEIEIKKTPYTETKKVSETVRKEELTFSGTEPTETDILERERLERDRLNRTDIDRTNLNRTDVDRTNLNRTDIDRTNLNRTDLDRSKKTKKQDVDVFPTDLNQ